MSRAVHREKGSGVAEVFVVGSINQDFVLKVEHRPEPGETVTDALLSKGNGGKGANQAAAAALLGASVVFLGRVGGDGFGEPLVRALAEKGVDTSLVEQAPGANRSLVPADVDAASAEIAEARVLVAQMEVPPEVVLRAVEVAAENGTRALVNLAPPFEVPRKLLERLDPLVVNEHEASFLLGESVDGVDGALAAAPELLSLGPSSAVITIGAAGVIFSDGESTAHIPAPKADVVDTTGAGDAFVGALAARLARDASLEDAVAYAVRAGAAAVTKEGAQDALPTPEVVVDL